MVGVLLMNSYAIVGYNNSDWSFGREKIIKEGAC